MALLTQSLDMNQSKLQEIMKDRGAGMLQSMGLQRVRHDLPTEQQRSAGMAGSIAGRVVELSL